MIETPVTGTLLQDLFGSTSVYLQLGRFLLTFLIGLLVTRTVLMPFVRRVTARHDAGKKTKHTLENITGIVGVFGAFTAALQAGNFGGLVTVISAVAGAATLAVGWGMRDQVGNMVSGVFLHLYPPFVRGDYIDVGEVTGTVKDSALMETTLRSNTGEKIVIPNSYLTARPMINQSKGSITQDSITLTIQPEKLRETEQELTRITEEYDEVLNSPTPKIMHTDITDGAVATELIYYLRDNQDIKQIRSTIIEQFMDVAVEKQLLADVDTDTSEDTDT